MQRAGRAAGAWWTSGALATVCDPISLEPLRALRYPPFELRADPTLDHGTAGDWFDGQVLASYLISTGNFAHPISRRDLTRVDCEALDQYLSLHRLGDQGDTRVTEAFDNKEDYKLPGGMSPSSRIAHLRLEADTLLQSLFSGGTTRRDERARGARRRDDGAVVRSDGNMTIVDDDQRPSHAASLHDHETSDDNLPSTTVGSQHVVPGAEAAGSSIGVCRSSYPAAPQAGVGIAVMGGVGAANQEYRLPEPPPPSGVGDEPTPRAEAFPALRSSRVAADVLPEEEWEQPRGRVTARFAMPGRSAWGSAAAQTTSRQV